LKLEKSRETFVVLSYFNYFCLFFSLQTTKSVHFGNKADLQWGLNNFDYNSVKNESWVL